MHGLPRPQRGQQPASRGSVGVAKDVSAGRPGLDHGGLEPVGDLGEVDRRTENVVPPTDNRDQVRPLRRGRVQLRTDDIGEEPPADGEVGVGERLPSGGSDGVEVLSQPVGPADEDARSVRVLVNEALGERGRRSRHTGSRPERGGRHSRQAPVDGGGALLGEQGVGAAERTRAEEARARRQRRGMRARPAGPSRAWAPARVPAPEDRDERAAAGHQRPDRAPGDLLPALGPVARRGAGADGEDPVEQQDAWSAHGVRSPFVGIGTPTSAVSSW